MSPARLLVVLASTMFLVAGIHPARAAEPESDAITKAWRTRAALAAKKLAAGGLDACDRAVELAFQRPMSKASGNNRMFLLSIEVGGETMQVGYSYDGPKPGTFVVGSLPPGWTVMQKAHSKTLSVFPGNEKCALDLCTSDPLVEGPCVEKPVR